jgi:probable HAF family extracellular repeat protein
MRRPLTKRALGLAPVASCLLAAAVHGQRYTITELAPFPAPGTYAQAWGINEHGWVAGQANRDPTDYPLAVVWAGNVLIELTGDGVSGARALSVNDAGRAVGGSDTFSGGNAFAWRPGELTPLPNGQLCCSLANDLDATGRIVGSVSFDFIGVNRAALWSGGQLVDLGTLGGLTSAAHAINDAGQIVGLADTTASGDWHAFRWDQGVMSDLGTLGGPRSVAIDIDEAGRVVGQAEPPGGLPVAVLWDGGQVTSLGAFPGGDTSSAAAINADGDIVGSARGGPGTSVRAALWRSGAIHDLNDLIPPGSGWVLDRATDINDAGEIVGNGTLGGFSAAFKLTPVGLERLVLAPLQPGLAGQPATLTATWPHPGERIEFHGALRTGEVESAGCPGSAFKLLDPVLFGSAVVDDRGSATLTLTLPASTRGRVVHLQAVQRDRCAVSNPVAQLVP